MSGDSVNCPECGAKLRLFWRESSSREEQEVRCSECGKDFLLQLPPHSHRPGRPTAHAKRA
jgi:transposase-like protein